MYSKNTLSFKNLLNVFLILNYITIISIKLHVSTIEKQPNGGIRDSKPSTPLNIIKKEKGKKTSSPNPNAKLWCNHMMYILDIPFMPRGQKVLSCVLETPN